MYETQERIDITHAQLVDYVLKFKEQGFRLVQIGCTTTQDGFEINYSFAQGYRFVNLKMPIGARRRGRQHQSHLPIRLHVRKRDTRPVRLCGFHTFRSITRAVCTRPPSKRLLRPSRRRSNMGKRSIVPFGPQHPVLPEPIHLDLVLEDEKVVEAIPSIGFHSPRPRKARRKERLYRIRLCRRAHLRHLLVHARHGLLPGCGGRHEHRRAAARRISAYHLGGAFPPAQPSAVDGAACRRFRVREPIHAELAPARESSRSV